MKKLFALFIIYFCTILQSCFFFNPCENEFTTYFRTIESVRGLFYSYDENGIYPYLDEYNRQELGIVVIEDSITERIEISQLNTSLANSAFACEENEIVFENKIDSINIFTKYAFDDEYLEGNNINALLEPLDAFENPTSGVDVYTLSFVYQHFKFARSPKFDTMQFIITGNIQTKGAFSVETPLVILQN